MKADVSRPLIELILSSLQNWRADFFLVVDEVTESQRVLAEALKRGSCHSQVIAGALYPAIFGEKYFLLTNEALENTE